MRFRHFCHCHARLRRARNDKGEGKYKIATPPLREARNDKAADPLKLDCEAFLTESLAMTFHSLSLRGAKRRSNLDICVFLKDEIATPPLREAPNDKKGNHLSS